MSLPRIRRNSIAILNNTVGGKVLDTGGMVDGSAIIYDSPNDRFTTAQFATPTYVDNAIASLVDSSPSALDTLNELATALGNDPNFATTVSTAIGNNTSEINALKLETHPAITLAGTPNYITIDGNQQITRNQIDLTTDVTGVLPKANSYAWDLDEVTQNGNSLSSGYLPYYNGTILDDSPLSNVSSNLYFIPPSPGKNFNIQTGGSINGLIIGADVNGTTITSGVRKNASIFMPECQTGNMTLIRGQSDTGGNLIHIGGGSLSGGNGYAASTISFFTSATFPTLIGTERVKIESNGDLTINNGATVVDAPVVDNDVIRKIDLEDASIDADFNSVSINGTPISTANPTLQDITDNGNTTTNSVTVNGLTSNGDIELPSINQTTFSQGTGDGATYTAYNSVLKGWNGLGMYNQTAGAPYPFAITGYYDFRRGIWDTKEGYRVNSVQVIDKNRDIYVNKINTSGEVTIASGATVADAPVNPTDVVRLTDLTNGSLNPAYDWGDHSGLYALIDHNHAGIYEPVITKNDAFNKSFGSVSGSVCEGNDSRLSDTRDWIASEVTQAEAEAGVATTARKWTAQRINQAIQALTPDVPSDSIGTAELAVRYKSRVAMAALNVDFSTGQVFTKTLTANSTLTFSNLHVGVKDLEITGNYSLALPTYVKIISGEYDGSVANLIQIVITNAASGSESGWCTISQEVA